MSDELIDTHCYCLSPRLRDPKVNLGSAEAEVSRAIHQHAEGPMALALSGPEKIRESMEVAGIQKSVLVSFPWHGLNHCVENNDYILEQGVKQPDQFMAVCSVSPQDKNYLKEAERVLEAGAKGIKLNPNWQKFALSRDDFLKDLNALVQQKNAYFLIHTDQAFKKSDAQAADIFQFAKANPYSKIVSAHMGGMLGVYANFELLKNKFQNIWFDTAVSETLYMLSLYVQSGQEDRVVFGTDYPFNLCHSQVDLVTRIKELDLTKQQRAKVFSQNYMKLLETKLS